MHNKITYNVHTKCKCIHNKNTVFVLNLLTIAYPIKLDIYRQISFYIHIFRMKTLSVFFFFKLLWTLLKKTRQFIIVTFNKQINFRCDFRPMPFNKSTNGTKCIENHSGDRVLEKFIHIRSCFNFTNKSNTIV